MQGSEPNPRQTLALLMGASTFRRAPKLAQGRAFYNSAQDFSEYLVAPAGLGLPRENVNWLFDDSRSPSDQLQDIRDFLESRSAALKSEGTAVQDLIFSYVGHGLFAGGEHDYCFAIRATDERSEGLTSIRAVDLAAILNGSARFLRKFLILDCCFSAAVYAEFQSGPLTAARVKLLDELPPRGTTLLCSASAQDPSLAPVGQTRTMFSEGLIRSLRQGHPSLGPRLSLSELGDLVKLTIREEYADAGVRPEVLSPDQREGDVASVPLFPNAAWVVQQAADEQRQVEAREKAEAQAKAEAEAREKEEAERKAREAAEEAARQAEAKRLREEAEAHERAEVERKAREAAEEAARQAEAKRLRDAAEATQKAEAERKAREAERELEAAKAQGEAEKRKRTEPEQIALNALQEALRQDLPESARKEAEARTPTEAERMALEAIEEALRRDEAERMRAAVDEMRRVEAARQAEANRMREEAAEAERANAEREASEAVADSIGREEAEKARRKGDSGRLAAGFAPQRRVEEAGWAGIATESAGAGWLGKWGEKRYILTWIAAASVVILLFGGIALYRHYSILHARMILKGHRSEVLSVGWSPDGTKLATASIDSTTKIWDSASGKELLSLQHDPAGRIGVLSVTWSPDGKQVATGNQNDTAVIWDAESGRELRTILPARPYLVTGVAWSPDGARLALADSGGSLRICNVDTGQTVLTMQTAASGMEGVAWSPDGRQLATGSGTEIEIWDAATGGEMLKIAGAISRPGGLAWRPDGKRLAIAGIDHSAKVWDAATGRLQVVLKGENSSLLSVTWSPDGKWVAGGSSTGTIRIWDAETGRDVLLLDSHAGQVNSLAWSPDGTRLLSGNGDSTARIWDVSKFERP
jgi:DNA-binding beta-propeller fold protein YncE